MGSMDNRDSDCNYPGGVPQVTHGTACTAPVAPAGCNDYVATRVGCCSVRGCGRMDCLVLVTRQSPGAVVGCGGTGMWAQQ